MLDPSRTHLIDDLPVERDLLGYGPYAHALAELLGEPELETPYCVGIYGAWGTGKTTFMSMVEQRLRFGSDSVVWFQPWLFDNKEEVWKALIYTALQHLDAVRARREITSEVQAERLNRLFVGLGKLTVNAALSALPTSTTNVEELSRAFSRTERDVTRFVNSFRLEFQTLKDELLGDDGTDAPRLVFFVDDLDRCTPESCITALEAIKLFFDMRGCIFVLGIDRELVQRGVETRYGEKAGIDGESYLEKLVQLPFHLPPVRADLFEGFLEEVTRELGFSHATRQLIALASEHNPRRAKRLASCLSLVRSVATRLPTEDEYTLDDEKLATALILQVRFPLEYLWMSRTDRTPTALLADQTKAAAEVQEHLTPLLGDPQAALRARRFVAFLGRAELARFEDEAEFARYLRLTDVIDVGDVGEPAVKRPLVELLDRRIGLDLTEPDEAQGPATDTPGDDAGPVAPLREAVDDALERWEWLRETASLRHALGVRPPTFRDLETRANELRTSIDVALTEADDAASSGPLPIYLVRDLTRLRTIDVERPVRGVRSALGWLAATLALSTAMVWLAFGLRVVYVQAWIEIVAGLVALTVFMLLRIAYVHWHLGRWSQPDAMVGPAADPML